VRPEIYRPSLLSEEQLTMFHTDDYVHFLQHVNPDNLHQYSMELSRYNVDVDCPGQTHTRTNGGA
jgi:acetoin utilization deacetylase AcuC-like enzyme